MRSWVSLLVISATLLAARKKGEWTVLTKWVKQWLATFINLLTLSEATQKALREFGEEFDRQRERWREQARWDQWKWDDKCRANDIYWDRRLRRW